MRKYIVGFVAGVLMTASVGTYAATSSLVGKKIQGESTTKLSDGTVIGPAIIIDGKSYGPIRSIGESAGYSVTMQGKDIILDKRGAPSVTEPSQRTLSAIEFDIQDWTIQKRMVEGQVYQFQKKIDNGEDTESNRQQLQQMKSTLEMVNQKLEALEKEKAALDPYANPAAGATVDPIIFKANDVVLSGE